MLVMVIQVNPTIDKVLYYLVLKDQVYLVGESRLNVLQGLAVRGFCSLNLGR